VELTEMTLICDKKVSCYKQITHLGETLNILSGVTKVFGHLRFAPSLQAYWML